MSTAPSNEVDDLQQTPFAVVVPFTPTLTAELDQELSHLDLLARLDELAPADAEAFALRLDARFSLVRARSMPRQHPPYRRLAEVIGEQHVFELHDVRGTVVGFRFPAYSERIEVSGYHLHFVSEDRTRGGHVLECTAGPGSIAVDPSADLHIELPAGVSLDSAELSAAAHAAVERVEHSG